MKPVRFLTGRIAGRVTLLAVIVTVSLTVAALGQSIFGPESNTMPPLPAPLAHAEDPGALTSWDDLNTLAEPATNPIDNPSAGAAGEPPIVPGEGPSSVDPAPVDQHEPQAMPVTPSLLEQGSAAPPPAPMCQDQDLDPIPTPGSPGSQGFWNSFREPMPPAPVWNPAGPKRVGLQAGHWRNDDLPRELARLAGSGTAGGGYAEWQVNLDIARRAAAILESYGVQVDILPAKVPPSYRAHAFVSIHADGDVSGALRGFKVARADFSAIPGTDDVLVDALNAKYGAATGLWRDDAHISRRMLYYYAFNSRRYCHSVAPGVPAAILEMGFLTNVADRAFLVGQSDRVAVGVANGVLSFLDYLDSQRR